ncbi:thioredoxin family protein [Mesosutterella sp. AGMB02718]|uniref:Thioredoxin family protein n=1 Tax=Mesosutterella faecium TaxID=2925194 RepID=A0ABT7IQF5_9BURK|nr:thioredoxin family protein [Mesosutterella sp. AGMB02718]MDL2059492.1 thioredoxin family protein [Mesosutterella sp. AGMB02718]
MFRKLAAAAVLFSCALALSGSAQASAKTSSTAFCPMQGRISIVDFEASWCTPCKMMKPAWEKVEKDYKGKISFVHIDIDEHPDIARALGISAVPTQILFDRKCKLLDAHSGFISEEDLRATFDHVLKNY